MRLEDIVTLVRDKVDDTQSKYWTDVQIVNWINIWVRDLFRQKADADVSYGNQVLDVLESETTKYEQFHAKAFLVYLPSWVYRVRWIEYLPDDSTPDGTQVRKERIPQFVPGSDQRSYGWDFHDNRTVIITGYPAFRSCRLFVAKKPALLHSGALQANSTADNQLYIPAANANSYPIEREDGALLGSAIELLTLDASHDPTGTVAVVTAQTREHVSAGTYRYSLTVRPQYTATPKLNDSYTMHAEVEEEHINYLVLRVAEAMHHRANNVNGLQSIGPQLSHEHARFLESIQPRADATTHFIRDPDDEALYINADRDPFWRGL